MRPDATELRLPFSSEKTRRKTKFRSVVRCQKVIRQLSVQWFPVHHLVAKDQKWRLHKSENIVTMCFLKILPNNFILLNILDGFYQSSETLLSNK